MLSESGLLALTFMLGKVVEIQIEGYAKMGCRLNLAFIYMDTMAAFGIIANALNCNSVIRCQRSNSLRVTAQPGQQRINMLLQWFGIAQTAIQPPTCARVFAS